jgi:hypothetical protein
MLAPVWVIYARFLLVRLRFSATADQEIRIFLLNLHYAPARIGCFVMIIVVTLLKGIHTAILALHKAGHAQPITPHALLGANVFTPQIPELITATIVNTIL